MGHATGLTNGSVECEAWKVDQGSSRSDCGGGGAVEEDGGSADSNMEKSASSPQYGSSDGGGGSVATSMALGSL